MGEIYGVYSTRDGQVRYVGQTEYTGQKDLDLIVTKALDRESGVLLDWIRDEWRSDHEVRAYRLQDDVIPADLDIFEKYWAEQFAELLNESPPANPGRKTTDVGSRVHASILASIKGVSAETGG